jgi:N-acetylmuramoyl-L-alanine amidase
MGDRWLTNLSDVLDDAGLVVVELDGWQQRSRSSGGYDYDLPDTIMTHHTASPPSASGEDDAWYCAEGDEDAPLSNLCLDRDGNWWVLAAGATNTNGKGGPLGGVPADSMNTHAIGVEANGGYGYDWPTTQTDSYLRGVRALKTAYGCPNVFAHFEWAPTRKVDPAGPSPWSPDSSSWDMDAFRADLTGTGGDDMPLTDEDIDRIAKAVAEEVWTTPIDTTGASAHIEPQPARYWLQRTYLIVREYLGGFPGRPAADPSMLQDVYNNTKTDAR